MKNCVIYLRVSTTKQAQEGESIESQEKICVAKSKSKNFHVVKIFKEFFSGKKDDRVVLGEMFEYIQNNTGKISAVFIRDIDRFTRSGSSVFNTFKSRLNKLGVELFDTRDIIQPAKNTLEDLGFSYSWSEVSPSTITESVVADAAKEEATRILTRTIGQQIRLASRGYRVREANLGFCNVKIEDETGKKKVVLKPDPVESIWIKRIFKLRSEGLLSDENICKEVNALGFKTRVQKKYDKKSRKIIGKSGGNKLTPGMLQKYIRRTIYAGVDVSKWTHYQPVKTPFDGLVSIKTFNEANRGKIIIQDNGSMGMEVQYSKNRKSRNKNNPDFPFRFVVRCPICKRPFKGSSSRSKSGKKHPYYHCERIHKGYRIPREEFHKSVGKYIEKLKLKPEMITLFEEVAINVWRENQKEALMTAKVAGELVAELKIKQENILDNIIATDNNTLKKKLEARLEDLDKQLDDAKRMRNQKENIEDKIRAYIQQAKYLVEHPYELLLNTGNQEQLMQVWSLVFEELPTYEDIKGGTPRLSLIFELISQSKLDKKRLAEAKRLLPYLD